MVVGLFAEGNRDVLVQPAAQIDLFTARAAKRHGAALRRIELLVASGTVDQRGHTDIIPRRGGIGYESPEDLPPEDFELDLSPPELVPPELLPPELVFFDEESLDFEPPSDDDLSALAPFLYDSLR